MNEKDRIKIERRQAKDEEVQRKSVRGGREQGPAAAGCVAGGMVYV